MSSRRARARSGSRCTNPSRSWVESRKPIPRPIPDSNSDADRERLNVTTHWYGFQALTIRSTCSSPVTTLSEPRRSSHVARTASTARAAAPGASWRAMTGAIRRDVDPAVGVELRVARVLGVAQRERDLARLARRQLEARPGGRRWAASRGRRTRWPRPPRGRAAGPSRGAARGTPRARCRTRQPARSSRRTPRGRAARGTRSGGRSRRPAARPRRSSSCAGSSWRRRSRPTGRTRPRRTARAGPASTARW